MAVEVYTIRPRMAPRPGLVADPLGDTISFIEQAQGVLNLVSTDADGQLDRSTLTALYAAETMISLALKSLCDVNAKGFN